MDEELDADLLPGLGMRRGGRASIFLVGLGDEEVLVGAAEGIVEERGEDRAGVGVGAGEEGEEPSKRVMVCSRLCR